MLLCNIICSLALFATASCASFKGNLNYESPSRRHPEMVVDTSRLRKRNNANENSTLLEGADVNFTHGVASGDPTEDAVILWTRAAPQEDNVASDFTTSGWQPTTESGGDLVCVKSKWSKDRNFEKDVGERQTFTGLEADYTVKIEATGLKPFTTYYYQFSICGSEKKSPVGRTKTLPAEDANIVEDIRLALYSCSDYTQGYFNAYGNVNAKDSVDYVVHLGDYIYEYKPDSAIGRNPLPDNELYSLYDYRKRIATYRTDSDLSESHRMFPWIPVWDDHEVANNAWREGSSNSDGEVFRKRKMAAVRAYYEWMPIRQVDMDDQLRIWRSFSFGSLFDLVMLDTRHYDRDLTVLKGLAGFGGNFNEIEQVADNTNRSLIGHKQETWLHDQIKKSSETKTKWRLIGNQVIFSRLTTGVLNNVPVNLDQWDGYSATRTRLLNFLYDNGIDNTIMLAGDSHASWASDLALDPNSKSKSKSNSANQLSTNNKNNNRPPSPPPEYDPRTGAGAIGVEFAIPAVSSRIPGLGLVVPPWLISKWLVRRNPVLQWQDLNYRGYVELSVSPRRVLARYFGVSSVEERVRGAEEVIVELEVLDGENRLRRNPRVGEGVGEG